ncbi:hypothetical protein WHR41_05973 [Cladosporium halotolerans]|uniref:Sulfatase N-terminal domain-containing protein n=1 Tax=Cladosporium halotolerans TaxID=1052096 RepID=A0AB34KKT3_9PEZI
MESRLPSSLVALAQTLLGVASRLLTRQFIFAVACVAILSAKLLHIYAHLDALQLHTVFGWGWSFFFQDTVVLLLLRLLLDQGIFATCIAFCISALLLLMGSGSTAFYITAGTELRWKNMKAIHDPSAFKMLATGIFMLLVVMAVLFVVSMVLQSVCFVVADTCIDVLRVPVNALYRLARKGFAKWRGKELPEEEEPKSYLLLSQDHDDDSDDFAYDLETNSAGSSQQTPPSASALMICLRLLVGFGMALQVLCTMFRPPDSSLVFLSWTLPLMPIVHLMVGATLSTVVALPVTFQHITALAPPIAFSWLPDKPHAGFEDWYNNKPHYSAEKDPLELSNLDQELLPELQKIDLGDVPIKHVMLMKLESTRKDVFPLKKNAGVWDRLASTFKNNTIPPKIEQQIASLTPMARYLTGDLENGFANGSHNLERNGRTFRGGISAQNAHTTATYTLKSLLGTHCGIVPLVADFNIEYTQHIYQPCLPHIFDAFNDLKCGNESNQGASNWTSKYMQSTTLGYDNQDLLMPKLGFSEDNIIGGEYLKEEGHKFPPKNISDVNYYGMPEIAIEDYLRDAFATAKKTGDRLFLSHLTSTSHHDFSLPEDEKMVDLAGNKDWDMLSRYLNSIGYVDRWLGKILDILDEQGVADETLIIFVGDHGLSIAEDNSFTPYHNPKISNFHVPLVVSHPSLPRINLTEPVTSLQILPTVLDLLLETQTLTPCEATAARELLRNYEGQSLLRSQKTISDDNKHLGWQFTIMNPGGSSLAVRDANHPELRLIVPLMAGSEWRFTDLAEDSYEKEAVLSFDFNTLVRRLDNQVQQAWVKKAVQMAEWWVEENRKRYRFKP